MLNEELSGSSRFIGRVGALAVALGIGAAIAGSPGVAWADEPDSAGSAASDSSNSEPAKSPSADSQDTADPAPKADTAPNDSDTDTEAATPATDADAQEPPVVSTKKSKSNKGHRAAEATEKTDTSEKPDPSEPADGTASAAAASSVQPQTAAAHDPVPTTDDTPQESAPIVQATVLTQPAEKPAPVAAAAPPPNIVADVVSGLLSVIGLTPQAAGGPATPPQSPVMWTMLGFVRREIGNAFAPSVAPAATSPLGTQQQLDAERTATATLNTLPVALMKLVLRFGFMSAAQQQFSLVGGPDQANIDRLDAAVNEYAMGAAFQQQILNSNQPTVVMQVAPPHTWYGQTVPGSRILYDNPDTIYRFMGVNGASSYVIRGRFDGDVPADTTFSVLTGLTGNTASVLTKDQLVLDPDGRSFTITADRGPANGRVNHLQLTGDSTLIATRNTLSDWTSEQPMSLEIARVGGPPNSLFSQLGGFAIPGLGPAVVNNPLLTTLVSLVPPLPFDPPILRGAVAAVIMALGIQREATYMAVATTDPATGEKIPPNVLKNPARNAEFLATQLQSAGYFQLADDEALVVTIHPNNAGYFVLPVTDDWTITRDYWNEQTSLNNSQAEADPIDGSYTVVISKTDPLVGGQHVANWVSTGGLNQGTISMRFQDLDPNAPHNPPTVSSQVVKLSDLGAVLPANTVYLSDQGRADQLAERKAGYDNRFAPYPQP